MTGPSPGNGRAGALAGERKRRGAVGDCSDAWWLENIDNLISIEKY